MRLFRNGGLAIRCITTLPTLLNFGLACRNRTHISRVEAECIIRYTKARNFQAIVKHTSLFVVAAAERHRNVFHYGLDVRIRTATNSFGDYGAANYTTPSIVNLKPTHCKLKTNA